MLTTCKHICDAMERLAPGYLQEEWDNSRLLVGAFDTEVARVLVALDATDGVIREAAALSADMIVCHHPLIFENLRRITEDGTTGSRLIKLIRRGVCLYAAHTNLDAAKGGVNDLLFDVLGLEDRQTLAPPPPDYPFGMGRVGSLPGETSLLEFAANVKTALSAPFVTFYGNGQTTVRRVGLCGGSGSNHEFLALAASKGCDVFVTGDVTYHRAQHALDLGICLIDATHYYTEYLVKNVIHDHLKAFCAENGFDTEIYISNADRPEMTRI